MDKPDTHYRQSRSTKGECCKDSECPSGRKNNYFEGKRLTADSFRVEQRYLIERRHLLNRAMFGWGVVYGYPIEAARPYRLKIGAGLALDECGRELPQACEIEIALDDIVDETKSDGQSTYQNECWLLSVHYAEEPLGRTTIEESCHCEREEWEHTCETVRYSLRPIRREDCCRGGECGLTCQCARGGCDAHEPSGPRERGGCRCICEHLMQLQPGDGCCTLTDVDEPCGGPVRVDRKHGVPLACITMAKDECGRWALDGKIEPCGPRRLVKRNDLLFDLIRGCDLTRISAIGWAAWHRSDVAVPFNDFRDAFGSGEQECITRDFWVEFSRPVRAGTVRPDCFAITVMTSEREGGWLDVFRVPVVRVDMSPDAQGLVRRATAVVDKDWFYDAVDGGRSIFYGGETAVEIEIRGDFIVDCNGQTVDADPIGLAATPTGNGTPGGTYLSTFRVEAREPVRHYATATDKGASS